MERIKELKKKIKPAHISELVDQFVFGKKSTRFRRYWRWFHYGSRRYLNLTSAMQIIRAVLRKMPVESHINMDNPFSLLETLAGADILELLLTSIQIAKNHNITIRKSDLEPVRWNRIKIR